MTKRKNKSTFRKQRKLADVQQHNERYERERLEALNPTPVFTTGGGNGSAWVAPLSYAVGNTGASAVVVNEKR